MLEFKDKCVIGIDLAASNKNPTGWASLKNKNVKTQLLYTDNEILENTLQNHPALIAIDAPLSLPKTGEFFRKTDKEMIRKGYRVLPPNFPTMKKLTLRAINLNKLIEEKTYKAIEVHPTSTRKALEMPLKKWKTIQENLKTLGLKGEIETRPLATHEIDAVTAAITAVLHLQSQTEHIGNDKEGYIIVPKKRNWKTLT
jgi:predicted nuclease with RNAse H fold